MKNHLSNQDTDYEIKFFYLSTYAICTTTDWMILGYIDIFRLNKVLLKQLLENDKC